LGGYLVDIACFRHYPPLYDYYHQHLDFFTKNPHRSLTGALTGQSGAGGQRFKEYTLRLDLRANIFVTFFYFDKIAGFEGLARFLF
jgi:hypothetical protein